MVTHWSTSPADTEHIASQLAQTLTGPAFIALHGELGAGKTCFVRGLVAGWGGDVNQVSSPTYVLLNRYQTPRGLIYHLDAYRIGGAEDFDGIGFEELLDDPSAIVIVEWPERVISLLPIQKIEFFFSIISPEKRKISINFGTSNSNK